MGFGGSDKIKTQADIVKTAGEMYSKRNISYSGMSKIFNLLKTLNVGHTVIKSPNGTVGVVVMYVFQTISNTIILVAIKNMHKIQ